MTEDNRPTCPICNKGKLLSLAGLLTCCWCKKMWLEWEFIGDCRDAGLEVIIDDNGITVLIPESNEVLEGEGR